MEKDKKQITGEMILELRGQLPDEAIDVHPSKPFLSTIKPIYIVERLNNVFGLGRWNIKYEIVNDDTEDVIIKGTFVAFDYDVAPIEQYGGNNNKDRGDAYKGAATDALTKIASYLEVGIDVFKGIQKPTKSRGKVLTPHRVVGQRTATPVEQRDIDITDQFFED